MSCIKSARRIWTFARRRSPIELCTSALSRNQLNAIASSSMYLNIGRSYTTDTATTTSSIVTNTTRSSIGSNRKRSKLPLSLVGVSSLLGLYYYYDSTRPLPLSRDHFIPLRIHSVKRVGTGTAILELDLPSSLLPSRPRDGVDKEERIESIFVKQPDLQIQRPYTPLSSKPFLESGKIELLVKRYNDGEVSRYLHRLGPGDEIQVKGPLLTTRIPTNEVDEVIFIVGGTGVTPAYQYLDTLVNEQRTLTSALPKVSIFYSASELVLTERLQRLQEEAKFGITLRTFTKGSRIDRSTLETRLGKMSEGSKKRLIIVCGPEGMITEIAGPRARDLSQGPVKGILGELGYSAKEVVKL